MVGASVDGEASADSAEFFDLVLWTKSMGGAHLDHGLILWIVGIFRLDTVQVTLSIHRTIHQSVDRSIRHLSVRLFVKNAEKNN